jgi:DNA invertase Pin-like site-specific DNA recombinase
LAEFSAVWAYTPILEEHASGADRSRPVLARLLREIRPGETLTVVRLDRLARSVSHLLVVIEQLEASAAHFRSLRDPIDTSTPQGMFSLQVLGAVAQLERALIAERTKAGLKAARARGRVGGNPGLRAHDPEAMTGWSGWWRASRQQRRSARCSRLPRNSSRCGNVLRAAERDGILLR